MGPSCAGGTPAKPQPPADQPERLEAIFQPLFESLEETAMDHIDNLVEEQTEGARPTSPQVLEYTSSYLAAARVPAAQARTL